MTDEELIGILRISGEAAHSYAAARIASLNLQLADLERSAADIEADHQKCVEDLKRQKNEAYAERNKLVALLCAIFPSSLEYRAEEEAGWNWIAFVDLPGGQATWHIHESELPLFAHVPRNAGRKWDGHSTEEKYKRVAVGTGHDSANRGT